MRWNIAPDLELAGGVRWTHENKVTTQQVTYRNPIGFNAYILAPGIVVEGRVPGTNYSPEATLTWHPRSDLTVYAAFKTGYKSGGVSTPSFKTASLPFRQLTFLPEKSKGGEVGVKGYFLDRRVRAELTGYYYDYTNLQVSTYSATAISFLIANAASARVKGIEGSLDFRVTDELTFKSSVGYNNARYKSFPGAPCTTPVGCTTVASPAGPVNFQDLSGAPLANAPDWSGSTGLTYDREMSDNVRLGLNADIDFSSYFFSGVENDPRVAQSAYARINAGARVYSSDDRWELALIGRNLNNKYVVGASSPHLNPGNFWIIGQRPRQVVVQAKFRF